MNHYQAKSTTLLTGCLLAGLAMTSQAAIIQTSQSGGSSGAFDGSIGVNLIQAGQGSLGSVTAPTGALNGTFNVSGLNDGSAAGNGNLTYYAVTDGLNGSIIMPDTITFQLTAGYDINSVEAITGWGDHNLGGQNFQLLLSINNGAFTDFGSYNNSTGGFTSGYLTTLTSSSGPIASDVTGIQFIFSNPDISNGLGSVGNSQAGGGSSGGTVIHELQVFGTPTTVPEPTTVALLGVAASLVVAKRRRASC